MTIQLPRGRGLPVVQMQYVLSVEEWVSGYRWA
jgi:hypothetical protein